MIKFCSKYIVTGVIIILITDYLINKWIGTGLLEHKSILGLITEFIIIDFIPLLIICYFASILITDVISRNVKGMYISLYFIINFICMLIQTAFLWNISLYGFLQRRFYQLLEGLCKPLVILFCSLLRTF